jgi:polar amino acid transport system substrate-binding protein
MKFSHVVVVAAVSAVVTLATVQWIRPSSNPGGAASVAPYGKAYERVMRTNTLRCGYILAPLIFTQDPNTGEMGGIYKESTDVLAKKLDLKVEWMETNFGTVVQDLIDGKIDAHCGGIWPSPARAKQLLFSQPHSFSSYGVFVRADDHRFDEKPLEQLNDPSVKILTLDGDMSAIIYKSQFSKASNISLPQNSEVSQMLEHVLTKKADMTFIDIATASEFLLKNPNSIRELYPNKPLRLLPIAYAVAKGEQQLMEMLDVALVEARYEGAFEPILKKYEKRPGDFYRVARPFEATP